MNSAPITYSISEGYKNTNKTLIHTRWKQNYIVLFESYQSSEKTVNCKTVWSMIYLLDICSFKLQSTSKNRDINAIFPWLEFCHSFSHKNLLDESRSEIDLGTQLKLLIDWKLEIFARDNVFNFFIGWTREKITLKNFKRSNQHLKERSISRQEKDEVK